MRIVVLTEQVGAGAREDERDVLAQAGFVEQALRTLGYEVSHLSLGLDLGAAAGALRDARPDLVFNLVESLAGQGRFIHVAPTLLDSLGLRYTGSGADATYLTSNKLCAKKILRGSGIPTPALLGDGSTLAKRYIVKSVWEHASVGLDEDSVVDAAVAEAELARRFGPDGFAEAYIDGREFNIAMLAGEVLPHAEMLFDGYGPGKARVVGYRAKWDDKSYEYHHTPRRFEFGPEDRPLLDTLSWLARACWRVFDLRGYARVDFRVDAAGCPFVLEVNTNPCLTPGAGFAAALERGGISGPSAVARILADAR